MSYCKIKANDIKLILNLAQNKNASLTLAYSIIQRPLSEAVFTFLRNFLKVDRNCPLEALCKNFYMGQMCWDS